MHRVCIILPECNLAGYYSHAHTRCSMMELFVVHTPEHLNVRDDDGWTPLHTAARFNRIPVLKLLVAQVRALIASRLLLFVWVC